jgi:hypothetical protein
MKLLCLLLPIALFITGCSTPQSGGTKAAPDKAPSGKRGETSEFMLTGPQIKVLGKFANEGNEDAAIKLMNYYVFVDQNKKLALHWCEVGAKHGSKICQHNLGLLRSGKA